MRYESDGSVVTCARRKKILWGTTYPETGACRITVRSEPRVADTGVGAAPADRLGRRTRDGRPDEVRQAEALMSGRYLAGVVSGLPFSATKTAASFAVTLPLLIAWWTLPVADVEDVAGLQRHRGIAFMLERYRAFLHERKDLGGVRVSPFRRPGRQLHHGHDGLAVRDAHVLLQNDVSLDLRGLLGVERRARRRFQWRRRQRFRLSSTS